MAKVLELLKAVFLKILEIILKGQSRKDPTEDPGTHVQKPEQQKEAPAKVEPVKQTKFPQPKMVEFASLEMKTRGSFPGGYPRGVVVHFTAGRDEAGIESAKSTVSWGKDQGFAFWCMDKNGIIIKTHDVSRWGHHAGSSSYPGLGGSVSEKLLGIEICNPGRLEKRGDKFFSWFGREIPANEVRHIEQPRYEGESTGYYAKYSQAQEDALKALILWLKSNSPNPDHFQIAYCLGHDEVCAPKYRKNDPGGALSISMPELRKQLAAQWLASNPK